MGNVKSKSHSIKNLMVTLCCVTAMVFAFALCGCSNNANTSSGSSSASASAASISSAKVTINVDADGYASDTSSPVFVGVTPNGGKVVYHAINANEPQTIEVAGTGEYSISFVSPINSDGSIYTIKDNNFALNVSDAGAISVSNNKDYSTASTESDENVEKSSKNSTASTSTNATESDISVKFDKVDADKVTKEQLDQIKSDIDKAIENGDDNIKQNKDNIKTTVEKNVAIVADSSAENSEKAKSESGDSKKDADGSSSTNTDKNGSSTGGDNDDNSSASDNGSSSGSGGEASQANSGSTDRIGTPASRDVVEEEMRQSRETHYHEWTIPVYETYTYATVVCNTCGAEFDSVGAWHNHSMERYDAGDDSHGSYSTPLHIVEELVGYRCECGAM